MPRGASGAIEYGVREVNEIHRPGVAVVAGADGVELLDERGLQLRYCNCSQIWSPDILPGGRLPRGYWKCPRGLGCN